MTNRLFGVLGVLAAIIVVFAVVVVVVAATRSGESFGERVASVVGMDSERSGREHEEAMSEDANDAEVDEMVEFLASIIEDDELSDGELAELEEWLDDDSEVFSFRDLDLFESDGERFKEEDGDGFEKRRGDAKGRPVRGFWRRSRGVARRSLRGRRIRGVDRGDGGILGRTRPAILDGATF